MLSSITRRLFRDQDRNNKPLGNRASRAIFFQLSKMSLSPNHTLTRRRPKRSKSTRANFRRHSIKLIISSITTTLDNSKVFLRRLTRLNINNVPLSSRILAIRRLQHRRTTKQFKPIRKNSTRRQLARRLNRNRLLPTIIKRRNRIRLPNTRPLLRIIMNTLVSLSLSLQRLNRRTLRSIKRRPNASKIRDTRLRFTLLRTIRPYSTLLRNLITIRSNPSKQVRQNAMTNRNSTILTTIRWNGTRLDLRRHGNITSNEQNRVRLLNNFIGTTLPHSYIRGFVKGRHRVPYLLPFSHSRALRSL